MSLLKITCKDCDKEFEIQKQCLEHRKFNSGEPICPECYKKISHSGKYDISSYPEEYAKYYYDKILDYEKIKGFIDKLKTKKNVKFICQECKMQEIMSVNAMRKRKICGIKPICRKCSLKFATSSEEWLEKNSRAQYIAQNRPEVIKKQKAAQARLMRDDPLYAEKRCSKSYISGVIRGMRFDSSWELYFMVRCWESKNILSIERYNGSIGYLDPIGKKRRYYPDFIVKFKNGTKKIVEIKGSKKYNNFLEKFNAARKKHGINYIVYEEDDLKDINIFFRRESFLRDFYRKYFKEITFYKNKRVDEFMRRIEKWLE